MVEDYSIFLNILGVFLLLILFYNLSSLSIKDHNANGIDANGIDANEKDPKDKNTVEPMANPIDSFCEHYQTIPAELKSEAEKLTKENCINTKCTIYVTTKDGTSKCVAGNESGPTYKTEDGVTVDIDNYYYMNKCYGKSCE